MDLQWVHTCTHSKTKEYAQDFYISKYVYSYQYMYGIHEANFKESYDSRFLNKHGIKASSSSSDP